MKKRLQDRKKELERLIQKGNKEDVITFLNNNDCAFSYDDNSQDAIEYLKTSNLFNNFLIEANSFKAGNDELNFIECLYSLNIITTKKLIERIEDSIICDFSTFNMLIWDKAHIANSLIADYTQYRFNADLNLK